MNNFLFSDAVLRRFLSNLTDYAIIILDTDGCVAAWNEGAAALCGYSPAEVMGEHHECFYTPEARAVGQPERDLALAASVGRAEEEGWRLRRDGSRFWAHSVITAIFDEHQELSGYGKVLQDFSGRKAAADHAQEMLRLLEQTSRTDYLTGLDNKRSLDILLSATASAARRHGRQFSIAVLNIDKFSAYNEVFGRQAADQYLRHTARCWRDNLRPEDNLSRYGGDEFVVMLPDTAQNGAMMCIDRIMGATPKPLTCSAGVAQWDGVEDVDRLLNRAGQAAARAKATQGHSLVFASAPEQTAGAPPVRPAWLRVVRRYEDSAPDDDAGLATG